MFKSMLLKTLVLSFCCALPFTAVYGMVEEENVSRYSTSAPGPKSKGTAQQDSQAMKADQWLSLPAEMWDGIFRYLSLKDMPKLMLVCKGFYSVPKDNNGLWAKFANPSQLEKFNTRSYQHRDLFREIIRDDAICDLKDPIYFTIVSQFDSPITVNIIYDYGYVKDAYHSTHSEQSKTMAVSINPKDQISLRKSKFSSIIADYCGIQRITHIHHLDGKGHPKKGWQPRKLSPLVQLYGTLILSPSEKSTYNICKYEVKNIDDDKQIKL
jgi:hypothetical protein